MGHGRAFGRQGGDVLARCLVKNNQERILSGQSRWQDWSLAFLRAALLDIGVFV
jgi:hypothetical protein